MKQVMLVAAIIAMLGGYTRADAAPPGDLSRIFGTGMQTCLLTATKTSLTADGQDSTTISLVVNGKPYPGAVEVTEDTMNTVVSGVRFPQTVTTSVAGTWVLMISRPTPLQGRCAPLTIQAN